MWFLARRKWANYAFLPVGQFRRAWRGGARDLLQEGQTAVPTLFGNSLAWVKDSPWLPLRKWLSGHVPFFPQLLGFEGWKWPNYEFSLFRRILGLRRRPPCDLLKEMAERRVSSFPQLLGFGGRLPVTSYRKEMA